MKRLVLMLLVLAACGETVRPTGAICTTPRPNLKTRRPVSPEQWYRFLVDRALDGGVADCTGAPVKWRAQAACWSGRATPKRPSISPASPVCRTPG